MRLRFLCFLSSIIAALAVTLPVSAHANLVRAEPGIGASVPTAPASVRLSFSEAPELRYSEIDVFNATHERFDKGDLHVARDDRESLIVSVRDLPQGIYTVVWKTTSAVDGHTTGGSFAFAVGAASLTSTAGTQSTVTFSKPTPLEVVTKWLTYLSVSAFLGAIILGLFIWTPAIAATARDPERDRVLAAAVNKRLRTLIVSALFVLMAATALGALVQVAKATGRSLVGALDGGLLRGYLFETWTGSIWCLRLFLTFLAAIALSPKILRVVRAPQQRETNLRIFAALLGLAVGVNELLTISLISHGAATAFWTPVTIALDWLHLLAAAIWIGGLVALVATVPLIARRTGGRSALMWAVVARFSRLALVCVGLLLLTGLYSAWVHIGSLDPLIMTDYGRALIIKLALIVGLVLLGAFNILRILPHFARMPTAEQETGQTSRIVRHFRQSIGGEVLLGAAVLLVVAILTGLVPSREATTQTGATALTQRAKTGDLTVALTPSTLQPGPITFDVFVAKGNSPVKDADRVILRFASRDLSIDETEATATSRGDGHYTLSGANTALAGTWQVGTIVRRTGKDDVRASFDLPVGSTLPPASTADPSKPTVTATTVLYGIAALVAVIAMLSGTQFLSRRRSSPRRETVRPLAPRAEPATED